MIREALEKQTRLYDGMGHFDAIAHFVLLHGIERAGSPLANGAPLMKMKECFRNATLLAVRAGYRYAEGYAIRPDLGIPMHHGWCVDDAGRVIDPTWRDPERCFYLGVEADAHKVAAIVTRIGYYGILATGVQYHYDVMDDLRPGFAAFAAKVSEQLTRNVPPFLKALTVTAEDKEMLK